MDAGAWNLIAAALPGAHILQTYQWGQLKNAYGWEPHQKIWRDDKGKVVAAALILERNVRLAGLWPLRVIYVPRGPLLDWEDVTLRQRILTDLQSFASERGAIFVKMDPELILGRGIPGVDGEDTAVGENVIDELKSGGWLLSGDQIQFRNTVWIDLTVSEEDMLGRMKQKTRYNIRLAEKKGVRVRTGDQEDFRMLYRLYAETSLRDGFVIRDEAYYRAVWEKFMSAGMAEPLIAEADGKPVAGLFLFHFADHAWYLYGMSSQEQREKMPNYLLQWEAMRRAKAAGCSVYDLWGAPDVFDESDSMWGVFRFKEGLGGTVVRTLGAWDYPSKPFMYRLYTQILPRVLDVLRARGKAKTRQEVTV